MSICFQKSVDPAFLTALRTVPHAQLLDLARQRRLHDAQAGRGPPEVELLGHGLEMGQEDVLDPGPGEAEAGQVMNDAGAFVEIQGTAEGHAFRMDELMALLALARGGTQSIMALQRAALEEAR